MVDLKKYTQEESYFSGINIVPFTDVVLVLLIIFMIAAPGLIRSGLDVRLPGARTGKNAASARLTLALTKDGRLFFEGRPLKISLLEKELKKRIKESPNLGVVLNADRHTLHGRVVSVLDIIRLAGIKRIYVGAVRK